MPTCKKVHDEILKIENEIGDTSHLSKEEKDKIALEFCTAISHVCA